MILFMDLVDDEDDRKQFEKIYYKYRKLCFSVAYDILQDEMLSEDAVQETFIRAAINFNKISKNFEGDCLKTKNYLVIITRRVAIDFLRSRKITGMNLFDDPNDMYLVEDKQNLDTEQDKLVFAMHKIPKEDADLLLLRYAYNLNFNELSDITGLKESSLRKKLSRIRKRLEKIMNGGESDD